MAAPSAGVVIRGLDEFRSELRRADPRLRKALTAAHKTLAIKVAARAQDKARSVSRQYAKAAAGIRPRARQTEASVALLAVSYPWILGAEFGSLQYRQFPPWRGNQWLAGVGPASGVGYALHPTIRDMAPQIADEYLDALTDAFRVAYPQGGG